MPSRLGKGKMKGFFKGRFVFRVSHQGFVNVEGLGSSCNLVYWNAEVL